MSNRNADLGDALLFLVEQSLRRDAKFINDYRESYPQGVFQSAFNLLHWCRTTTSSNNAAATEESVDAVMRAWERDFRLLSLPWLKSLSLGVTRLSSGNASGPRPHIKWLKLLPVIRRE